MKVCVMCCEEKRESEFYRRRDSKDGRRSECKTCHTDATLRRYRENPQAVIDRSTAWRKANPEKFAACVARWAKNNPEKRLASMARYKKAHPERHSASVKRYAKANPAKRVAWEMRRVARKLNATPAWANEVFIEEAYDLAALRTKITGFKWEVDHFYPLQSDVVCGLHVENNLQVIPATLNRQKGNRHPEDSSYRVWR